MNRKGNLHAHTVWGEMSRVYPRRYWNELAMRNLRNTAKLLRAYGMPVQSAKDRGNEGKEVEPIEGS
jgi:hypothetical protein